ncbi:MAG: prolyl oligopeptidase family serine peptidase [Aulosira sp. ZfuVER01]|nr:prolyl oligopeptidase family serine peptidase [Aulosira sp. ZfuVER01]MDZ7996614.1 prolyl oligopeptidase family serine peptidase [Aulosira sp. DedVER01a]MDZ8052987.1 prolyl oligopeptidase family serine peptidase [Aulosira sp. ZfuCHP01]
MHSTQQGITQTNSYNYLLFLPQNYEEQQSHPMILFLHGAGEKGDNLNWVKRHGVARIVEEQLDFPFVVASPQCPQREHWDVYRLNVLLDEVIHNYRVDLQRIYLTGLSMGGYGTWHLAISQPQRFAAIAPICGGGDSKQAYKIKHLPIWVFHGARDRVVAINESEEMVRALEAIGSNIKFTIYPEAEHDSWTQTYSNPALYEWFLQHRNTN